MLVDFGLMYMMCNAIAPSNSESIPYWSEHIQKVQNLFFILLFLKLLIVGIQNLYMLVEAKRLLFGIYRYNLFLLTTSIWTFDKKSNDDKIYLCMSCNIIFQYRNNVCNTNWRTCPIKIKTNPIISYNNPPLILHSQRHPPSKIPIYCKNKPFDVMFWEHQKYIKMMWIGSLFY